jgi:hypothetical protein
MPLMLLSLFLSLSLSLSLLSDHAPLLNHVFPTTIKGCLAPVLKGMGLLNQNIQNCEPKSTFLLFKWIYLGYLLQ